METFSTVYSIKIFLLSWLGSSGSSGTYPVAMLLYTLTISVSVTCKNGSLQKSSNAITCHKWWCVTNTVSHKYAPPPFATLALVQSARGSHTWDATFSLAITPSLLVPHPQLRVQIEEDNAFDNFAVAIWMLFIHVAVPCRNRRLFCHVFQSHCCVILLNFR